MKTISKSTIYAGFLCSIQTEGGKVTVHYRFPDSVECTVVFFTEDGSPGGEAVERVLRRILDILERRQMPVRPALMRVAFVCKAEQIVRQHLSDDTFGSEALGAALFVSRAHLHRKLKETTGLSTTNFIHRIRIQEACALLRGSTCSIKEIAYAVGYNDPNYFTRVFTSIMGMSPSQYVDSDNGV